MKGHPCGHRERESAFAPYLRFDPPVSSHDGAAFAFNGDRFTITAQWNPATAHGLVFVLNCPERHEVRVDREATPEKVAAMCPCGWRVVVMRRELLVQSGRLSLEVRAVPPPFEAGA